MDESEIQPAVDDGLTCLHRLGIEIPAHPTEDQVQAEYETFGQTLGGRSIETLIDLPLMTDPELGAAIRCYRTFSPRLLCGPVCFVLQACRTMTISIQHGISDDSANAYAFWGSDWICPTLPLR